MAIAGQAAHLLDGETGARPPLGVEGSPCALLGSQDSDSRRLSDHWRPAGSRHVPGSQGWCTLMCSTVRELHAEQGSQSWALLSAWLRGLEDHNTMTAQLQALCHKPSTLST